MQTEKFASFHYTLIRLKQLRPKKKYDFLNSPLFFTSKRSVDRYQIGPRRVLRRTAVRVTRKCEVKLREICTGVKLLQKLHPKLPVSIAPNIGRVCLKTNLHVKIYRTDFQVQSHGLIYSLQLVDRFIYLLVYRPDNQSRFLSSNSFSLLNWAKQPC